MSAAETARDQLLAISETLYLAGRGGLTPEQIATQTALPLDLVKRRLNSCGPGCVTLGFRRFAYDKLAGRWTLTLGGEQMLKESGRATTSKKPKKL